MELKELISLQQKFDGRHKTNFPWDQSISENDLRMLEYLALALCGESGEVANAVKKVIRGDITYEQQREAVISEIVDVLIYVMKFAYQMGFDLETAYHQKMEYNESKFRPYEHE